MKNIEQQISALIEQQFPAFYLDEGPNFVAFVKAYFEWLDLEGGESRKILEYRDIDYTVDDFLDKFKNEYLVNLPATTESDRKFLIKHVQDLYKSKGSTQSFELFFKLVFDEDIEVYDPSTDVLRASDGIWNVPYYLECYPTERAKTYIGKVITGSGSGAEAFVENVIRRKIKTRLLDIIFISNIKGNFSTGDRITDDDDLSEAPLIVGSLNSIEITSGGANNIVGDVFTITSDDGQEATAVVRSTEEGTGKVAFTLTDGGYGYSNTSSVYVSNSVLSLTSVNGAIQPLMSVIQPSTNATAIVVDSNATAVGLMSIVGTFVSDGAIKCYIGEPIGLSTTNTISANIYGTSTFYTNTVSVGDTVYVRSNSATIGVVSTVVNNTLITLTANSPLVVSNSTLWHTNIKATCNTGTYYSSGSAATFNIGTLANTESISVGNTLLAFYNSANVCFLDMLLDGSNSGLASNAYGFPGNATTNAASSNTPLLKCLSNTTMTIGNILSLTSINPGVNYNADPFVTIREKYVAGYDKEDLTITLSNTNDLFQPGHQLNQNQTLTHYNFTVSSSTGAFQLGEGVIQQLTTNAYGIITAANNTRLTVDVVNGTFTSTNNVVGYITGANAVVSAVNTSSSFVIADGYIRSVNGSVLVVKNTAFNYNFAVNGNVYSTDSNGTTRGLGTIGAVDVNNTHRQMGFNAEIDSEATTTSGIVSSLEILNSGYGYTANSELELINASNTEKTSLFGTANIIRQGKGLGFWKDNRGKLNSDKYLHDNDFYQEYSYEIQSGLSLNTYADMVKQVLHVSGTKLFGRTIIQSENNIQVSSPGAEITT